MISICKVASFTDTELRGSVLALQLGLVGALSQSLAVAFPVLFLKQLLLRRWLGIWSQNRGLPAGWVVNYDARVYVGAAYDV